ncbi:MAG TPA: hypothetical protein VLI06_19440 [Solimonas sp.]|nr:hypothetical protein [Solimonas sp.]
MAFTSLATGCKDGDGPGSTGGGGGGGGGSTSTLSGVAAVGAPIVAGAVTIKCSDGRTHSDTTSATGSYSKQVPQTSLPCAVRVSGGTIAGAANTRSYHSFATRSGVVNVTPLTDLVVALASGMSPSAWFDAIAATAPPRLAQLTPSATTLLSRLEAAGYALPAGFSPFTTAFTAASGNSYDDLLEALAAALEGAGVSYEELLAAIDADPSGFDVPPPDDGGSGGGTPNGVTTPATINPALVQSITLIYHQSAAGAPFADQAEVPVVIAADGSLQIDGKTLRDGFNRNFGSGPHLPEIIWLDAARNLEYALSDNERGIFNEINVGDSSAPVTGGIPRFLGQLRMPEVEGEIPAQITARAGSYAPLALRKSSSFANTIGSAVPVVIDGSTGVITVDGKFSFDPAAEDYSFFDNLSSLEPHYSVNSVHTDGDPISLRVYIQDDEVVGFLLEKSHEISEGVFSTATLYMEIRPLAANVLAFFDEAVSRTPVVLTVVQDDTGYNSGYSKCEQIRLTTFKNGTGDAVAFTYFLHKGVDFANYVEQEVYSRADTRYLENSGNHILQFKRNRLSLRADGFVDVTAVFAGADKDRATNDPTQVAANCP